MSQDKISPLAAIRAERRQLQDEEDAISFVRRLSQGRLDLVQDELRRRASGADAPVGSLAERLAEVFGQQHGGGSARPPRETNIAADHPLIKDLDELCDLYQFASMENIDERALSDLESGLSMFEKNCSQLRHELFERIDALTASLVASVRESGTAAVVKDS